MGRIMRGVWVLFTLCLSLVLALSACTTKTYQGAGIGGTVGAAAGAMIDKDNRWRGAVIGGALGSVLGGGLVEITQRSSVQAAQTGRSVSYSQGTTYVVSEPLGVPYQGRSNTTCRKVRTRVWENGTLKADKVEEICEATKTEPRY